METEQEASTQIDVELLMERINELAERQRESLRVLIDADEHKWTSHMDKHVDSSTSVNLDERLLKWRATCDFPVAKRALKLYDQLLFGPGFGIGVKPRRAGEKTETDRTLNEAVASEWEETIEANINSWSVQEFGHRAFRDGEAFTIMDGEVGEDEYLKLRFADPEEFYDKEYRQQRGSDGQIEDSKGILTNPLDATEVLAYTRYIDPDADPQIIPAEKMLHVKIDCDSNEKRGRSRFDKLYIRVCQLDEFATVEFQHRRAQASIVLHRKVAGGKTNANLVLDAAMAQYVDNTLTPVEKVPPGTTVTTNPNIELDFVHPEGSYSDASGIGAWLTKIICQVTGFSYEMLSADVSEGNLASAQIGETPVSQMITSERQFFVRRMLPLFKAVVNKGIEKGRIPGKIDTFWKEYKIDPVFTPAETRDMQKVAQAMNLGVMAKAVSVAEFSRALQLDPDKMRREVEDESKLEFLKPDEQLPSPADGAASSKSNAAKGGTNSNGAHSDNKGSGKT